jgi:ATP:corrinoid adenosyltransferase
MTGPLKRPIVSIRGCHRGECYPEDELRLAVVWRGKGGGGSTEIIGYGFKRDAGNGVGVSIVHFTKDSTGSLV